jgi:phosphoserine phosphatase RsbX
MVLGAESGDMHFVKESPDGVLLAAIDGVGHGSPAADASRLAAETLASSPEKDTVSLVWQCHEALRHTRGAVMTMAFFCLRTATVTWVGVGNIEGVWYHADSIGQVRPRHVLLRGGVVGHRLPPMRAEIVPMVPRDTLILATDGIRPEFTEAFTPNEAPQVLADRILEGYRKGTDDALVLVVRCLGDEPV